MRSELFDVGIVSASDGFVVVQASEGPAVPKYNHKGVSDWLS